MLEHPQSHNYETVEPYGFKLKVKMLWIGQSAGKTRKGILRDYYVGHLNMKLAPTVDRKDPSKGYEIENMEWVTHSENSSRGAINRNKMFK